jgi:hypothetical protein
VKLQRIKNESGGFVSYQLNRVHLLICIFAGLVLTCGFVWRLFFEIPSPLFTMAMWVSFAIVFFYFVGHIVRSILISKVFDKPVVHYDLSEDEEYQKFMASLDSDGEPVENVMFEEPVFAPEEEISFEEEKYVSSLNDAS